MHPAKRIGISSEQRLTIALLLVTVLAMSVTVAASPAAGAPASKTRGTPGANFVPKGHGYIRLAYKAFDPLATGEPSTPGALRAKAAQGKQSWWLVQLDYPIRRPARDAVKRLASRSNGYIPEATFVLEMTPQNAARARAIPGVRWVGLYHPAYKLRPAYAGSPGVLSLKGTQAFRAFLNRREPLAPALAAIGAIKGVRVDSRRATSRVIPFTSTAAALPAVAALHQVSWISEAPVLRLHNYEARWASDTGERDTFRATAPGNLTGAGQTSAVADTGVNYVTDIGGNAHRAFADFGPGGAKVASYQQAVPGDSQEALFARVASGSNHRKIAAYYDLGGDGYEPSEASNHGTHTAGSIAADYPDSNGSYGTYGGRFDGADGVAPGAHLVVQDVSSGPDGSLGGLPSDHYDLFEQVYDAAPGTTSATTHPNGSEFHQNTTHSYQPTLDARTHNYSIGSAVPLVDLGDAAAADGFVYDHEDFVASASAGNNGPEISTVSGGPQVSKNMLTSCASANGRQPMVTLDSAAIFSSHGPTADNRLKPDVCTPGQIVISPKGATSGDDHYLQGTSMSSPLLTGLATLVRQYFYDGFGPAPASGAFAGYAPGTRAAARRWNPSAALVRGVLINSADRMRGRYTGDAGDQSATDGQWPSAGQGWGRVELDNTLVFGSEARRLYVADVWNTSAQALDTSAINYTIPVAAGEPLGITVTWTDPPSALPAGTAPLVNNLDLTVTAPDGTVYTGNNFTTQSGLVFNSPAGDPAAEIGESRPGAGAPDTKNNVEAVRIQTPAAGNWTVRIDGGADPTNVIGTPEGKQGYALIVSGLVGTGAGPAARPAESVKPAISDVRVQSVSADLAIVTWNTNEPTTGAVLLTGPAGQTRFDDVHNPSTFPGLTTPQNENKGEYVDKKVVGTAHEVRLTGLSPGTSYSLKIEATDLAPTPNVATSAAQAWTSTAAMFQPKATDMAQLVSGDGTTGAPVPGAQQQWGASTQLYTGRAGNTISDPPVVGPTGGPRNTYLPAFMFRLPATLDPATITGAAVELTSAHDITNHYTDDVRFRVSMMDSSVESDWGPGKSYESVANAPVTAVAVPETGYRRGAGHKYLFSLSCADLAALRGNLSEDSGEERRAAFRVQSETSAAESLFSFEFGFGRRSRGPEHRPRLLLQIKGTDPQSCQSTAAPTISDVRVQSAAGASPDRVVVSWETDIPSSSIVLYRRTGTSAWNQVGTPFRTTDHLVSVGGLSAFGRYEFAVRSRTCNGLETTNDNARKGYALFPESSVAPKIDRVWADVGADRSATIRWVSDVDSTAKVEYGTSSSSLSQTATPDGDAATEARRAHEVKIPPLQPCTTYYFRAVSTNRAGKRGASAILTFNTPSDQLTDVAPMETFDIGLGGWTVKTASAGLPPTEWAANGAAAKTTLGGTTPGYGSNVETRLVSPPFTVGGRTLELSFTETFQSEPDFDFGVVEYSVDDGRSWKSVRAISGIAATQPRSVKVPITGVAAGSIRIGFRFSSDGNTEVQPGWSVDDVILREVAACTGLAAPTAPARQPKTSSAFRPLPVTGPVPAPAAPAGIDVSTVRTDVNPASSLSPAHSNATCVRVLGAAINRRPLPPTGIGIGWIPALAALLAAVWLRRRLTEPLHPSG